MLAASVTLPGAFQKLQSLGLLENRRSVPILGHHCINTRLLRYFLLIVPSDSSTASDSQESLSMLEEKHRTLPSTLECIGAEFHPLLNSQPLTSPKLPPEMGLSIDPKLAEVYIFLAFI